MNWSSPVDNGVLLRIRVVPNAKRTALAGVQQDGSLRIRIQAPPVDRKANKALIPIAAKFGWI